MSARDNYAVFAPLEQYDAMTKEIDRLRRWKAQAEAVIEEWDTVWEEVGCPGKLGQTKSRNILELIRQLQDHKAQLREELTKHGWGDFHYGDQGQDPKIVQLLEETK